MLVASAREIAIVARNSWYRNSVIGLSSSFSSKFSKPKKGDDDNQENTEKKETKSDIEWMLKFFDANQRAERFVIPASFSNCCIIPLFFLNRLHTDTNLYFQRKKNWSILE
jgi:hypothetical protein